MGGASKESGGRFVATFVPPAVLARLDARARQARRSRSAVLRDLVIRAVGNGTVGRA